MKKIINLILLILFSTISAYAQGEIEVTGTVTDEKNEALIGVYVVVKDRPGVGTVTDLDGRYRIKADQYATLIVSYTGYDRQEVQIAKRPVIDIQLKPSDLSVLKEVVVTGGGIQKKATITGAITTVELNMLRPPTGNITNALAGNVAGIIAMQTSGEPGNNASEFWIRGISTFGGGASALVLVDGFERAFNEINIEDIESFSVLKDASATAIYGSKGANGVILITTKKGEAGKININAKAEYGYMTRTRTPEFVGGYDYAKLANEALITRNREPLYTSTELDIFKYGLDPDLYPDVNWQDVMLRDGANMYRTTVELSGGGSTVRYFASGGYIDEGGMYKADQALKDYKTNANMSRWNYRVNVDFDITKTTLIKIGVSGYLEKQNTPGLSTNDAIWKSLIGQSPVSIPVMYSNGLVPAYGTGEQTNPWVLATQTGYNEFWKNKAETNITLEQNLNFITEGLRFIGRAAYDTENRNNIRRLKWPEQYSVERKRDRDGNLIMKRVSTESLMHQESSSWGQRVFVMEGDLMYDKIVEQHHRIGALVRYNQRERVETSDIGDDIMRGIARRNLGIAGRVTYALYDRYMAEFNFGYTGSENFKKGNQFGLFPAVSGAWNVSEESFIKKNTPWLDLFKIRYSYGEVGNDAVRGDEIRFPYLSSIGSMDGYEFADYNSNNVYTGLHYSQVASSYLTWEVAKKHNLGFDLNVFKNKLSATVDFFKDNREKIYKEREYLPSMAGITSKPWANVGKMESRGFDGQIRFIQRVSDFEFTLRGNITYAKNEVLEYDEQASELPYRMTQGYRWDQARGLIAEGLFKNYEEIRNSPKQTFGEYLPGDIKYKDVNGDGVINDDDIVPIGATRVPNLVYGAALSILWKGIDFNIHFQGSGKSSYFIDGVSVYPFSGGSWGNILTDVANPNDRWISQAISGDPATERTDAKYPRLSYGGNSNNYRQSTFWLRNGAYLRLKTLEIGYTLPRSITSVAHVRKARVYFLGNNLALWDTLKLWDPELGSGSGMAYPPSRTLILGLTVSF